MISTWLLLTGLMSWCHTLWKSCGYGPHRETQDVHFGCRPKWPNMIHILHYLLPVWHLLTSLSFQSLIVAACATELPWVPCHSAPPDLHVHLRTTCSETFKNCKYKSPLSLAHTRPYTGSEGVWDGFSVSCFSMFSGNLQHILSCTSNTCDPKWFWPTVMLSNHK